MNPRSPSFLRARGCRGPRECRRRRRRSRVAGYASLSHLSCGGRDLRGVSPQVSLWPDRCLGMAAPKPDPAGHGRSSRACGAGTTRWRAGLAGQHLAAAAVVPPAVGRAATGCSPGPADAPERERPVGRSVGSWGVRIRRSQSPTCAEAATRLSCLAVSCDRRHCRAGGRPSPARAPRHRSRRSEPGPTAR
jgi:hypothetical protein